MEVKYLPKICSAKKLISGYLILIFIVSLFGDALVGNSIPKAEAAQKNIDIDANATPTLHLMSGAQTVFTDDQTGYKFYVDAPGYCVYRKTTDGGSTWSATTSVDAQTDCLAVSVWYDKWTPGSASSSIHIATIDGSADDVFYNRLDTTSDTLLLGSSPVSAVTNPAQGGTLVTAQNQVTITRGTDGTIYAASIDASDSYVVECTSTCSTATNWTETGTNPFGLVNHYAILLPLSSGNIMAIIRDVNSDDIGSRIWNNSTWSASTTFDKNAPDNTTYDVGMAAVVSSTTPDTVYLAYVSSSTALGTDDLIKTRKYSGGAWATTTHVFASTTRGITNVAIALDAANDDVYVAYSAQTTAGNAATGNVYWKTATSSMTLWSAEVGPINTGANDMYGVDLNVASDERIHASWFTNTGDDIIGDTIADIFPGIHATTSATQTASVLASTSNFYIGGELVIFENYRSRDVTGITITESGTIDASVALANIKLLYEMDTTSPYNCASVSYDGSESPFGSTDTNGFSGPDGTASFTGTTVTVSTTSALCVYTVMDVLDKAVSSSTIEIEIADPSTDITVTDGTAGPTQRKAIASSTIVYNDTPTLTHYHWRRDNGSETTASSATNGVENTALTSMRQGSTTRLRLQVSNEGSSSTPAMQYRLEYAPNPSSCDLVDTWIDVGDAGGDFDMSNTANLTDGANTTNIATTTGGVSNANTTFLTPNAGVKDTSSQTANITLSTSQYVELEYAIVASTTAVEGNTYCFRVSNQGASLFTYDQYPRANIAADVSVTVATSSQRATTSIPQANVYVGSAFVITENVSSRSVTGVTLGEVGTVDGSLGLSNIKLKYDLDATAPYNCLSESYGGSEPQFGATSTLGFSSSNGTTSFSGSVTISTTSTMCLYTIIDITNAASNGETVDIVMMDPSTLLTVTGGGSVSPSITRDMNGSTTFVGAILTQTHYHWRNDNGGEATSTSATNGNPDTVLTNVAQATPVRLRMQVSNEGTVTSASTTMHLEYATKLTTCSAATTWIDVDELAGAWNMYDSMFLVNGTNTTNIATGTGGFTDENTTFLTPNGAVRDASSTIGTSTLTSTQFLEAEFSLQQTVDAGFDVTYCFRIVTAGAPLNVYTSYPELTTSPERDFEIQRGTLTIAASSTTGTITAGVNYTAPAASTSAFIRITNIGLTGAGHNTGATAAQNATNTTVYILNPSNIMTSVTFARTGISSTTRVSWEIIEFIGESGSDNEMIVRSQTTLQYAAASTSATGTVASVVDDADVVVFITAQQNPDTGSTNYESGLNTSEWNAASNQPIFRRGVSGSDAGRVSYAVVEFTGQNWAIQRVQHTFTTAGLTETENITAVGSLARTFIHTQKRNTNGLNGTDEFGAEVWLSSIGQASFFLESGATTPSGQTSVIWIIENTQTTDGAMEVTRTSGATSVSPAPITISVSNGKTLTDITNASIFTNARSSVAGTTFTRSMAGVTIASTTHYEIWRSAVGSTLTYRTEIVEWPTAGLALHQSHFQLFVDNSALLPTDPWPDGASNLGEDAELTATDEPLGEGEYIRIRMSVQALNATFPAGTKAFKLQYGAQVTTCGALAEDKWTTLGNTSSSTVWRGLNATGTTDGTLLSGDPPTLGDLVLPLSDVAGTFEEINDTSVNTYAVPVNDEIEYDWIVEQNGASAETTYCFRMIESNGSPLGSYSSAYPRIRTASFSPRTQNWRWYDDESSVTPITALAVENSAPVNIANGQGVHLRVTVKEIENIARDDVRFKLQYSEYADFTIVSDVVATSTCTATSTWCYIDGGGGDNEIIASSTLSDADTCLASVGNGCGTHNESPEVRTGFRHQNNAAAEYAFTIQSAGPRVNRVYYFRLYDLVQDIPVEKNTSEAYPSLVTEGADLSFTFEGVSSGSVIEGITTDITTTPASVPFGVVPMNTSLEGVHRLSIDSNGTQGHQILMMLTGDPMTSAGTPLLYVTGTNALPTGWNTGCSISATSCFGYHTGDDTLQGGSTRFSAVDTYARFSTTTLEEVSYSSQPVAGETTDIVFRLYIRSLQSAGRYETNIRYVSVPVF